MKRWLAILPLALLVALAGLAFVNLRGASRGPSGAMFDSPERPAPDYVFAALAGEPVAVASPGRPILVNFWASWCTPCRAEHPLLLEMKAQGAEIIGVLYKDRTEAGLAVLAADGDPFARVAVDPSGDGGIAFGISGVPETFLISAEGRIVETRRGPLDPASAQRMMAAYNSLKADAGAAGMAGEVAGSTP